MKENEMTIRPERTHDNLGLPFLVQVKSPEELKTLLAALPPLNAVWSWALAGPISDHCWEGHSGASDDGYYWLNPTSLGYWGDQLLDEPYTGPIGDALLTAEEAKKVFAILAKGRARYRAFLRLKKKAR
jgi:hypothetical protein